MVGFKLKSYFMNILKLLSLLDGNGEVKDSTNILKKRYKSGILSSRKTLTHPGVTESLLAFHPFLLLLRIA